MYAYIYVQVELSLWVCRQRAAGKAQGDGAKRTHRRDRPARAGAAPEANAELQSNLDVCLIITCCSFILYSS